MSPLGQDHDHEFQERVIQIASRLPKVQLHLHLDGSLTLAFLQFRAKARNLPLPSPPQTLRAHLLSQKAALLKQHNYVQSPRANWPAFTLLNTYLQTAEELQHATSSLLYDLITCHNVRVLELRFCPTLHTRESLTELAAVRVVTTSYRIAISRSSRKIRGGILLVALRSYPPAHIEEMARLASSFKGAGVVGLDLAGDEASYPLDIHADALREAARHIPVTIHAGERGPRQKENLRLAVEIGARRVGHAIVLRDDDQDLLGALLREKNIAVELCITGNCTGGGKIPEDRFDLHPVKRMLKREITVAGFNCDNLLLSGTPRNTPGPAEEIVRARVGCGLSWRQIRKVLVDGARASFDPMGSPAEVELFLREFAAEVDEVLNPIIRAD